MSETAPRRDDADAQNPATIELGDALGAERRAKSQASRRSSRIRPAVRGTVELDETDMAILGFLRHNARISNAEIARRVGLAPSAIFQRIRKLEEAGVIRGYTAVLESRSLGYDLSAFVMIRTNERASAHDTAALLAELPHVREVHRVVGEDCFFVRVQVPDTDTLTHVLDDRIRPIPSVASTRTTIILHTAKDEKGPPLPAAGPDLRRNAS